jgi:hypothetical protein
MPVSRVLLLLFTATGLWLGGGPAPARAEADPRAVAVSERLTDAMGGRELYDAQRVLTFRFAVVVDGEERSNWLHVWDRDTGDYRLEGTTREGDALLVLFNVDSGVGKVWLGGAPLDEDAAASYLEMAYGRYINDSYWLLMPWKWLDPGVTLTYTGTDTVGGEAVDVVQLSFETGIGITSNDVYWAYVSRETGLMVQWAFLLQDEEGNPGAGDRSYYRWEEWEPVDAGVKFARNRIRREEGRTVEIRFPLVECARQPRVGVFEPPPPPPTSDPR